MNSIIKSKFSNLQDSRLALIERLKNIPAEKLEAHPAEGKWSVAQIFYHLNRAESFSTIYVSKKRLDVNNLKKTGFMEALKLLTLKILFKMPIALKAPVKVLGDVPEKVDYKLITEEWNATRVRLKALIESLPEDMLYKNVFKQPAIGRINIFQMLDFMQAHFNRHKSQVEKIVN